MIGILMNHSSVPFDPNIYDNGTMSRNVIQTDTYVTKGTASFEGSYITLRNTYGNVSNVAAGLQVKLPSNKYTTMKATFVRTQGSNMYLSLYAANTVVNPRNGTKLAGTRGNYNAGTTVLTVDISSVSGTVYLCVGIDTNNESWGTTRNFRITNITLE